MAVGTWLIYQKENELSAANERLQKNNTDGSIERYKT